MVADRPFEQMQSLRHFGPSLLAKRIILRDIYLGDLHLGSMSARLLNKPAPPWLPVHGLIALRKLGFNRIHVDFPGRLIRWK